MRALLALAAVVTLMLAAAAASRAQGADPTSLVNPFVGTSGTKIGGSIDDFPGADVPFGMVQWSPDTPSSPPAGGYEYKDTALTGFSLTHLSGAGCNAFTDFRITPTIGPVRAAHVQLPFSHADETASPGYYEVTTSQPRIRTQLTVTKRTGLGAFTFPENATRGNLLIDVSSDQAGANDAEFRVSGRSEISGWVSSGSFCGMPDTFTAYVVVRFDRPFVATGTWNGATLTPDGTHARGPNAGGWVTFDTSQQHTVRAQASVSWVSVAGARANLNAEATTWDVAAVRAAAAAAWRQRLSEVRISGGTPAQQRTFYTALYHAMLHPNVYSDADGRYRGFDERVHRVRSGHAEYANFSGWDIYRTQIPLIALLAPHATSDMMRSLLDASQQMGWLPKWPLVNGESDVMGGDPADPILAGAHAFGARDFNARAALRAMIKGATDTTSPPGQGWYVEREGSREYQRHGYVVNVHTTNVSPVPNGASMTLEYALDDFSIAQFARALRDERTYVAFMKRSQNWANLFDRTTGLIAPRNGDGAFVRTSLTENGQSGFQEGNAWQYTWMVPQNLGGLVDALGGSSAAIARLNAFFAKLNAGQSEPYAWFGNEPSLASAWTYLYAGAPYREQAIAHQVMATLYTDAPDGIPGNDDLGTMSAWYAWNAMGLYPIDPAVPVLLLSSPIFSHVTLTSPNGTSISIDAPQAGGENAYVESARTNGVAAQRSWIRLPIGGHVALAYALGSAPNVTWGASPADAPPSYGYGPLVLPPSTLATLRAPDRTVAVAPRASVPLSFGVSNGDRSPERISYRFETSPGVDVQPSRGSVVVAANGNVPVAADVRAPAASGLYDAVMLARTAGGAVLARATAAIRVTGGASRLGFVANFSDDTVTPFDPRTHAFGYPIAVGKSPGGIAMDARGERVYVANQSSNDVSVIDVASEKVLATVKVGGVPAGIRVSPDGRTVWVANYRDGTVQSIDATTFAASAPVAVGKNPEGVAFSPDGSTLYVVDQGDNQVTPISVATHTARAPIAVGPRPLGVAVSPDGRRIYVSAMGDNTVGVFDTASGRTIATIPVGKVPQGLAISPDGRLLLVANSGSNDVTPIDLRTNRAMRAIRVGNGPFDVGFTSDGRTAFVPDTGDGDVVPIDVRALRALAPIPTGSFPIAIAVP